MNRKKYLYAAAGVLSLLIVGSIYAWSVISRPIVREYPHTFAVLSDAREVVGNFKRLDSKGMPERELLDKGENQMA